MKTKKTVTQTCRHFTAILITAQFLLTPFAAVADTINAQNTNKGTDWSKTLATIMQAGQQITSGISQNMQNSYNQAAAQQAYAQSVAQMNPSNCGGTQCKSELFPQCNVLMSKPNLIKPGACKDPISLSDPNSGNKAGQAMGYSEHFAQMENLYDNFMVEGQPSNIGMSCLKASQESLSQKLTDREKEVGNLIAKMNDKFNEFKKGLEARRTEIEDATALLEGDNFKSPRAQQTLAGNDVKFAETFGNTDCNAIFNNDEMKKHGSKGLKGIESKVSEVANEKGSMGYSAMQFDSRTRGVVEAEIRKMADLAGRETSLKGVSALNPQSYSGYIGQSPTFQSTLSEQGKEAELKKVELQNKVANFYDGEDKNLLENIFNDNANLQVNFGNWERDQKNKCLMGQSNMSSLVSGKIKIIDPDGSKHANKFNDSSFRMYIRETMNRNDISIDEKLKLITAEEGRLGNANFIVDTKTSSIIDGKIVDNTTRMTPARFIQEHVKNCNQQFEQNVNSKGFTKRQVMDKLKEARGIYAKQRAELSSKVRDSILKRMITCDSELQASANGGSACTPGDLSSNKPGFCLNRASSCSQKMRSCLDIAQKKVTEVTKKREVAVGVYKQNLANAESAMLAMYRDFQNITLQDGMMLGAQFKSSFELPTDIKLSIDPNNRKSVQGLDALAVHDPDQYFELMQKNLNALRKTIQNQNKDIEKKVVDHMNKVKSNMEQAKAKIVEYKQMCEEKVQQFMTATEQMRQKQMEAQQKQQEAVAEYCSQAATMDYGPGCERADELDAMMQAAAKVPGTQADISNMRKYKSLCKQFGADDNQDVMSASQFTKLAGVKDIAKFCKDPTTLKTGACDNYVKFNDFCSLKNPSYEVFSEHASATITGEAKEKCFPGNKFDRTGVYGTNGNQKCELLKTNECEEVGTDREKLAEAVINEYKDSIQKNRVTDNQDKFSELGENKSMACSGGNNSTVGAIKSVFDQMTPNNQIYNATSN